MLTIDKQNNNISAEKTAWKALLLVSEWAELLKYERT